MLGSALWVGLGKSHTGTISVVAVANSAEMEGPSGANSAAWGSPGGLGCCSGKAAGRSEPELRGVW